MVKINPKTGDETVDTRRFYNNETVPVLPATDLNELYDRAISQINKKFVKFVKKGSGWKVLKVLRLEMFVNRFETWKGSRYMELPKFVKDKEGRC